MKKKHIVLLTVLFLFSALLPVLPFSTRAAESAYLRRTFSTTNFISISNAAAFICDPTETGYEIVAFSENGTMKPANVGDGLFDGMESTLRLTLEPQQGMNLYYTPRKDLFDVFPYPQYTDYVGFIVKEEGKVVSSTLYKVYTIDDHWTVAFEELGSWEYPLASGWISETCVENELRKAAALDRIFTLDSALNRMAQ